MATTISQVLESAYSNVQRSLSDVKSSPVFTESEEGPPPENFWLDIGSATQQISHEVTKLTMALSHPPKPSVKSVQDLANGVEAAWCTLLAASKKAPPKGTLLQKELRAAILRIGEALGASFKALTAARGEELQFTGWVWEACAAVDKLPRDNLAAICSLLTKEEVLLTDALQEIEEEVKCSRLNDEQLDNSVMWTNQDRELLAPCVGLVRTARASVRKVGEAVRTRGELVVKTEHLDRLADAAEKLSPAVDTFIESVYPPMNKTAVSAAALVVVNVVREFLELARQSECTAESDNEWLTFLLRAVDHNNNKVQPLLSPSC